MITYRHIYTSYYCWIMAFKPLNNRLCGSIHQVEKYGLLPRSREWKMKFPGVGVEFPLSVEIFAIFWGQEWKKSDEKRRGKTNVLLFRWVAKNRCPGVVFTTAGVGFRSAGVGFEIILTCLGRGDAMLFKLVHSAVNKIFYYFSLPEKLTIVPVGGSAPLFGCPPPPPFKEFFSGPM